MIEFTKKVDTCFATLRSFSKEESKIVFEKVGTAVDSLEKGDTSQMEIIFAFLKLKQGLKRGGYLKERICRRLKKMNFNEEQKAILQEILLEQLVFGGREFRDYIKLAPKILSLEFKKNIEALDDQGVAYIRKRKRDLLSYIDSFTNREIGFRRDRGSSNST